MQKFGINQLLKIGVLVSILMQASLASADVKLTCSVTQSSGRFEGAQQINILQTQNRNASEGSDPRLFLIDMQLPSGPTLVKVRPDKVKQTEDRIEFRDDKMDERVYLTIKKDGSGQLIEKGDVIDGLGRIGEIFADSSIIVFENCAAN